ncbi:hypothetical protein QL285_001869 [Trifolium repens]|nr:hypothetical protein QL285_032692 [Trifolium repens]KAK2449453.1 hypothetical protein QL285_008648 [Trifolium repens]KAK2454290.1 hypothetical protein QL285_001869 [Trifolium repens]
MHTMCLTKCCSELLLISAVPTNTIITARCGESLSFLSLAATRATHNNRPKREGCLHCGGADFKRLEVP